MDSDLGKKRGEGRKYRLFAEIAELNRILGRDLAINRDFRQRNSSVPDSNAAIRKFQSVGILIAHLAGDFLAQLHAGGTEPGGRA